MNIVNVAGEARPFIKTGGLADVAYSLSKELAAMGENVSVIIPYYKKIKSANFNLKYMLSFDVTLSWRHQKANVFVCNYDGIHFYLVQNDYYFNRDSVYGDADDGERFAFFSLACKELLYRLPQRADIIQVHDWHVGMLPAIIKNDVYANEYFKKAKFILTIHNPAFQGFLDRSALSDLYNLPESLYDEGSVRFNDRVSTLKSAITYVDKITTVSPTHHLELLTSEGSMGLSSCLTYREYDFSGILNGIDYDEFNPENDKSIPCTYSLKNYVSGKKNNKESVLKLFNLPVKNKPVFSMVSRITWQKGLDIALPAIKELVKQGAYFLLLGSGEKRYEEAFEELRKEYPNNVGVYIGYNDSLAHQIYAASDFFLMPSLFEPCGLGQLIAQRYGTLPIVRRTGGLKDSVICFNEENLETANGFGFDGYNAKECVDTCLYALKTYEDRVKMRRLAFNAMKTDNTWNKSANSYLSLYKSVLK